MPDTQASISAKATHGAPADLCSTHELTLQTKPTHGVCQLVMLDTQAKRFNLSRHTASAN